MNFLRGAIFPAMEGPRPPFVRLSLRSNMGGADVFVDVATLIEDGFLVPVDEALESPDEMVMDLRCLVRGLGLGFESEVGLARSTLSIKPCSLIPEGDDLLSQAGTTIKATAHKHTTLEDFNMTTSLFCLFTNLEHRLID